MAIIKLYLNMRIPGYCKSSGDGAWLFVFIFNDLRVSDRWCIRLRQKESENELLQNEEVLDMPNLIEIQGIHINGF